MGRPTKNAAPDAEAIQADYYTRTADEYDAWHVNPGDEHYRALAHISALVDLHGLRSLVDVGTGTGRALQYLARRHPDLELRGVEPVEALRRRAHAERGVPEDAIDDARGEALPYPDDSFDAACELGVLHHVADPAAVVREMTRVARRAVFISDDNRFGWGRLDQRLVRLALWRTGLWDLAVRVRTRGRGYRISDDDGLAYSYSVFDSYDLLARWADDVLVVSTSDRPGSWRHPRLTADHVLLAAIRR
jgi:SAM-dependent methyltransferase